MAITVKTADQAASKWQERSAGAAQLMADGALAAADKWATNTAAAAENYQQAITAGNIKDRFKNGVRRAGPTKFARMVESKASSRYSSGVAAAQSDYSAGVSPYLSTIGGLTLSPRKPRGDPSNYNRVAEVGRALHAKRVAMMASSS